MKIVLETEREPIMIALDIAAFFLVTTDLYGPQRLQALSERISVFQFPASLKIWEHIAVPFRILLRGLSIYIVILTPFTAIWFFPSLQSSEFWLVSLVRDYSLIIAGMAAIAPLAIVALALFAFGFTRAVAIIIKKVTFKGALVFTGALLFLVEKIIAIVAWTQS